MELKHSGIFIGSPRNVGKTLLLERVDVFLLLGDNFLDLFACQTEGCYMGNGRLSSDRGKRSCFIFNA